MAAIWTDADRLLRARGGFSPGSADDLVWRRGVAIVLAFAPIYGLFMGSFHFDSPERMLMVLYAAVKMPMLLLVTAAICLPGFFVINTVLGLRDDVPAALRAIIAGQAGLSVALASLGPLTRVFYLSVGGHDEALMFNAAMFTLATAAGQVVMLRLYWPLIARDRRHLAMLILWVALYAFVGMQMGWTLRPFVGTPGAPVTFFREEPFSNAYVEIARIFLGL